MHFSFNVNLKKKNNKKKKIASFGIISMQGKKIGCVTGNTKIKKKKTSKLLC